MNTQLKPTSLPSSEGAEWLDLVIADSEGKPQRVMGIGTTLLLDNGEHVAISLVRNGYRKAWRPA